MLVLMLLLCWIFPTTTLVLGQEGLGHAEGVPESNIAVWSPLLVMTFSIHVSSHGELLPWNSGLAEASRSLS